ncbi:MAG: sulfate transporter family protein [Beijerinckiaceae bacterium]|nr:MAG: sulfate transporter family protein [Beijerinckiaceae bacterium]
MYFDAAVAAFQQIFTPPFRRVFIKTLALTFLLLIGFFIGAEKLFVAWLVLPYAWLTTVLSVIVGLSVVVGLAFAITPVSFIVAGFFFDELAAIVEAGVDPSGPVGKTPPLGDVVRVAAKFTLVAVLVNLLALVLLLVPGVNAIVFFLANAYLFGRGYFELAALRYRTIEDVDAMRRLYGLQIFIAGLFVSGLAAVPVVNLLVPLFGAAFMVRVHKGLSRRFAG